LLVGLLCTLLAVGQAHADDPPSASTGSSPVEKLTPRPLTSIEKLLGRPPSIELLWQVIDRDLAYGRLDEAAKHLRELLEREDLSGEVLLDLREKFGANLIIRLSRHPELAEQAQPLLDMLRQASQARAADGKRIQYFIGKLDDSASERDYALEQINRSEALAVPYYIEALKDGSVKGDALVRGMLTLPRSAWTALSAALESKDEGLLTVLLDVLLKLGEPRAAESMYIIVGSSDYSAPLRDQARRTIARLRQKGEDQLGSPVARLIEIARRYDAHESGLGDPADPFTLWRWTGDNVSATTTTVAQAEEYFGLRAVQQALRLAPQSREAKIAFLKLALETSTLREGIDRPLPDGVDGALEASLASGPDLLLATLEESLTERRPALALSAVRALSDTASPTVISGDPTRPSPLVKALTFPNSRVRFEAAVAALELHSNRSFADAGQVVANLVQAIDPHEKPTALILDWDLTRAQNTAALFSPLGYEPLAAISGTDGLAQARTSGLVELLVIDAEIRNPTLLDTIDSFEKDWRTAGLPTLVIARDPLPDTIADRLARYPNIAVLPPINDPKKLALAIAAALPDRALAPWTATERDQRRSTALDWLVRLARGEMSGVDLNTAIDPLTRLLNEEGLAGRAAEALAYLPNAQVQLSLAATALDGSLSPPTRAAAARSLARNIARGTNALPQADTQKLLRSLDSAQEPSLRRALAAVVGSIDRQGQSAAERMNRYQPGQLEPRESADPPVDPSNAPPADPLPAEAK
jgi:hypothetical protein